MFIGILNDRTTHLWSLLHPVEKIHGTRSIPYEPDGVNSKTSSQVRFISNKTVGPPYTLQTFVKINSVSPSNPSLRSNDGHRSPISCHYDDS